MAICGKKTFTKLEAQAAIRRNKRSSKQYRKEIREYYCRRCNAWHLTSTELKTDKEPLLFFEEWKEILKQQKHDKR